MILRDQLTPLGWRKTGKTVLSCHAEERLGFIHLLQRIVDRKGYRVSLLSGDAHVGGVGRLFSRPKRKDLR